MTRLQLIGAKHYAILAVLIIPFFPAASAFAQSAPTTQAALGTFGDSPRNVLRAPGLFNLDWSVSKSFRISERFSTELRGDFFDLLNNPHFNAPGSSVAGTCTFGKISSAADPRIVQVAVRIRF